MARSFGDLSENFEYKAAKREKNRNDSRIRYLENMIKTAVVIDGTAAGDGVALFDKVTFYLEEEETEETIQLVTTLRQDALKGLISKESPVGKALLGHQVGDRVCIHVSDSYHYYVQIRKIEKTGEDHIPISTFFENSQPLPGGTRAGAFWVRFLLRTRSRKGRQAKGKGSCKGAPWAKSAAKPVPYPPDGFNVLGTVGVEFNFIPDVFDVHRDRGDISIGIHPPDAVNRRSLENTVSGCSAKKRSRSYSLLVMLVSLPLTQTRRLSRSISSPRTFSISGRAFSRLPTKRWNVPLPGPPVHWGRRAWSCSHPPPTPGPAPCQCRRPGQR